MRKPIPVEDGEVLPPRDAFLTSESAVRAYLSKKPECRIDTSLAIAKDSKDITKKELQAIADTIRMAKENRIIVSMGTDHISQHGVRLKSLLAGSEKCVVLVAAHVPIANGEVTDGYRNLNAALAHVKTMPPGIDVTVPRSLATREAVEHWPAGAMFKNLFTRTFMPAEIYEEKETEGTRLATRELGWSR